MRDISFSIATGERGADWSQLESFEGTILPVVHDRYLIKRFASDIWQVFDGKLRII